MKKFDALLSNEIPSKSNSDLTDSLEIHSNVLKFPSNDTNASLELVFGKQTVATNVNPAKLKGHNLSAHTMRNTLPAFLLQLYTNPCLYWLHQPAFYVLLQKLNTPKEQITTELERLKQIFSSEFVTCKSAAGKGSKDILKIMDSINISENEELGNMLLTSILPYIYCYFNVVDVIKNQVTVQY